MLLIHLRFTHYSPKDSEDGLKELLLAESVEQALPYIDKEYLYDHLKDAEDDEAYHSVDDDWWEQHPGRKEEAVAMGLTVNEYGSVEGPAHVMTRWWRGNSWKEASDAYYGVTHYDWDIAKPVTDEEAAVLLKLGLAKDIRNWKPDSE